ncbi:MAG: glycoside hydrolase family 2 protein, partial [Promethearchaeota archaeon]
MKKIILNKDWRLVQEDAAIDVPTLVPGSVFETLINENIIEDPFYGLNEKKVSWVYNSDWQYSVTFDLDKALLKHEYVFMKFYGIDTVAKIELNGTVLGNTDNMFRSYTYDVKSILKDKENQLKILIKSPTVEAKKRMKKYKKKLRTLDGIPGVPYLRKAQYSFGWDWGPKLPDIGVWKPVEIILVNDLYIENFNVKQEFERGKSKNTTGSRNDLSGKNEKSFPDVTRAHLQIQVNLNILNEDLVNPQSNEDKKHKLVLELKSPDGKLIKKEEKVQDSRVNFECQIDDPDLWWTWDLGNPSLYQVKLSLVDNESNIIVQEITRRIGLREIELVRKKDKWGETFFFKLNGVPVFSKGANWIPVDSFIPRGMRMGLHETLLEQARAANMNMIRVWGGGIYEDDLFYNKCDELGIMVWQDFPFACALYPIHESFVENVKKEARENIIRIRHHPSLALWCGNNEIEQMWVGLAALYKILLPWDVKKYKKGYLDLFEKILPKLVSELDPQRSYWPSSPSNGAKKNSRGLLNSNSQYQGDSHFWKVWHLGSPFSEFRNFNSRFMSEYGFESFPSMKTIRTFCPPDQFDFHSPIMENHQKNRAGNKKIMNYMNKRFKIPESFENQVQLSQITQAEAIEYGIEHWRRNRNDFLCMGSLYWQLNDCWPV